MAQKKRINRLRSFIRVRGGSDGWINCATIILLIFGMLMTASASIASREKIVSEVLLSSLRQGVFVASGLLLYNWLSHHFKWSWVQQNIVFLAILVGIIMIATRVFGATNGAYAWIRIPGTSFSIQPSEFAKVVLILFFAVALGESKKPNIGGFKAIRWPLLLYFVYLIIIVFVQKDLGSGVIMAAVGLIVFLIPSQRVYRKTQVLAAILIVVAVGAVLFFMTDKGIELLSKMEIFDYMIARFKSVRAPLADRYNTSYQLVNSLIGLARGNLTGVGFGNSIQKFGYLTFADTDFIFAIIVEELGILGIIFVFVPYAIILYSLIRYAILVKPVNDKMVLVGTGALLFIHMFLNIGGVTALIPLTGVPLLLISRGGSSLWATMILLGICQNIISRYKYTISAEMTAQGATK